MPVAPRVLVFVLTFGACAARAQSAAWVVVERTSRETIWQRAHPGSDLLEWRVVGTMAAPPAAVQRALLDVERYRGLLPHCTQVEILRRDAEVVDSWQRFDMPLLQPRDTVVRLKGGAAGDARTVAWWSVPGAARDGMLRMPVNHGSWLLEPAGGGARTRVTYTLFLDPGGFVPAFIVNAASAGSLRGLFERVEARAQGKP